MKESVPAEVAEGGGAVRSELGTKTLLAETNSNNTFTLGSPRTQHYIAHLCVQMTTGHQILTGVCACEGRVSPPSHLTPLCLNGDLVTQGLHYCFARTVHGDGFQGQHD